MSTNKVYYDTYAKEVYALYNSFRLAGFDYDNAFELTKICIEKSYIDDRLKASSNNLKSCEEKEKNHGKIQWSPWDNHV